MTSDDHSSTQIPSLSRRGFLHRLSTAGAGLALAGCTTRDSAHAPPRWVQLFNGRNLDGWTPKIRGYPSGVNFGNTFRVVDGLLTVAYDAYDTYKERFGHLFYNGVFSHYRLRAEYRFIGTQVPGGPGWAVRNSGLMLHGQSPQSMTLDQDFPASIEAQLLGGDGTHARTTLNLCTPGTHVVINGKLHTPHCINSTSKTYHGDQWVTAEVEVHGNGVIRHLIDDQVVLAYEQAQLDERDASAQRLLAAGAPKMISSGTISLQSESHPIQFRKVELLRINA